VNTTIFIQNYFQRRYFHLAIKVSRQWGQSEDPSSNRCLSRDPIPMPLELADSALNILKRHNSRLYSRPIKPHQKET